MEGPSHRGPAGASSNLGERRGELLRPYGLTLLELLPLSAVGEPVGVPAVGTGAEKEEGGGFTC